MFGGPIVGPDHSVPVNDPFHWTHRYLFELKSLPAWSVQVALSKERNDSDKGNRLGIPIFGEGRAQFFSVADGKIRRGASFKSTGAPQTHLMDHYDMFPYQVYLKFLALHQYFVVSAVLDRTEDMKVPYLIGTKRPNATIPGVKLSSRLTDAEKYLMSKHLGFWALCHGLHTKELENKTTSFTSKLLDSVDQMVFRYSSNIIPGRSVRVARGIALEGSLEFAMRNILQGQNVLDIVNEMDKLNKMFDLIIYKLTGQRSFSTVSNGLLMPAKVNFGSIFENLHVDMSYINSKLDLEAALKRFSCGDSEAYGTLLLKQYVNHLRISKDVLSKALQSESYGRDDKGCKLAALGYNPDKVIQIKPSNFTAHLYGANTYWTIDGREHITQEKQTNEEVYDFYSAYKSANYYRSMRSFVEMDRKGFTYYTILPVDAPEVNFLEIPPGIKIIDAIVNDNVRSLKVSLPSVYQEFMHKGGLPVVLLRAKDGKSVDCYIIKKESNLLTDNIISPGEFTTMSQMLTGFAQNQRDSLFDVLKVQKRKGRRARRETRENDLHAVPNYSILPGMNSQILSQLEEDEWEFDIKYSLWQSLVYNCRLLNFIETGAISNNQRINLIAKIDYSLFSRVITSMVQEVFGQDVLARLDLAVSSELFNFNDIQMVFQTIRSISEGFRPNPILSGREDYQKYGDLAEECAKLSMENKNLAPASREYRENSAKISKLINQSKEVKLTSEESNNILGYGLYNLLKDVIEADRGKKDVEQTIELKVKKTEFLLIQTNLSYENSRKELVTLKEVKTDPKVREEIRLRKIGAKISGDITRITRELQDEVIEEFTIENSKAIERPTRPALTVFEEMTELFAVINENNSVGFFGRVRNFFGSNIDFQTFQDFQKEAKVLQDKINALGDKKDQASLDKKAAFERELEDRATGLQNLYGKFEEIVKKYDSVFAVIKSILNKNRAEEDELAYAKLFTKALGDYIDLSGDSEGKTFLKGNKLPNVTLNKRIPEIQELLKSVDAKLDDASKVKVIASVNEKIAKEVNVLAPVEEYKKKLVALVKGILDKEKSVIQKSTGGGSGFRAVQVAFEEAIESVKTGLNTDSFVVRSKTFVAEFKEGAINSAPSDDLVDYMKDLRRAKYQAKVDELNKLQIEAAKNETDKKVNEAKINLVKKEDPKLTNEQIAEKIKTITLEASAEEEIKKEVNKSLQFESLTMDQGQISATRLAFKQSFSEIEKAMTAVSDKIIALKAERDKAGLIGTLESAVGSLVSSNLSLTDAIIDQLADLSDAWSNMKVYRERLHRIGIDEDIRTNLKVDVVNKYNEQLLVFLDTCSSCWLNELLDMPELLDDLTMTRILEKRVGKDGESIEKYIARTGKELKFNKGAVLVLLTQILTRDVYNPYIGLDERLFAQFLNYLLVYLIGKFTGIEGLYFSTTFENTVIGSFNFTDWKVEDNFLDFVEVNTTNNLDNVQDVLVKFLHMDVQGTYGKRYDARMKARVESLKSILDQNAGKNFFMKASIEAEYKALKKRTSWTGRASKAIPFPAAGVNAGEILDKIKAFDDQISRLDGVQIRQQSQTLLEKAEKVKEEAQEAYEELDDRVSNLETLINSAEENIKVPNQAPETPDQAPDQAPETPNQAPEIPNQAPEIPNQAPEVQTPGTETPDQAPETLEGRSPNSEIVDG